jgi:hypothetical protein
LRGIIMPVERLDRVQEEPTAPGFLELVNDGVLFSDLAEELKEALLDGLCERTGEDAFLAPKIAREATHTNTDANAGDEPLSERERAKKAYVDTIFSLVRGISEKLAAHRWTADADFRAALGRPNTTGKPFVEQATDSLQVLQIKQLINALYYFETGLKLIESDGIGLSSWLWSTRAGGGVESAYNASSAYAAGVSSWVQNTRAGGAFAGMYNASSAYAAGASSWAQSTRVGGAVAGMYNASSAYAAGASSWAQSTQVGAAVSQIGLVMACNLPRAVDPFYQAFQLITHIEPDTLGAFEPEFKKIKTLFSSKVFADLSKKAKNMMEKSSATAYVPGLLLDQLRPARKGGVDYSLLVQLTTALGQVLDENTEGLQDFFSDSNNIFAKLREFVAGDAEETATFDRVQRAVQTEMGTPGLGRLKKVSAELSDALGALRGSPLDVYYYLLIASKASTLLSEISTKATELNSESKRAIRELVILLKNHCLVQLAGLSDKMEVVSSSALGSLTTPLITKLDAYYGQLIDTLGGVVDLSDIREFQDNAFLEKRLEMACAHKTLQESKKEDVEDVLRMALAYLTHPAPSLVERRRVARAYQILQPHLERVDLALSQQLLQALKLPLSSRTYPVIDTHKPEHQACLDKLEVRFRQIERNHDLAIRLNDTLIADLHALGAAEVQVDNPPTGGINRKLAAAIKAFETDATVEALTRTVPLVDRVEEQLGLDAVSQSIRDRIDENGDDSSPLSLKHLPGYLKGWTDFFQETRSLNDNAYKPMYLKYSLNVFSALGSAFMNMHPYVVNAYGVYANASQSGQTAYQTHIAPYMPQDGSLYSWAYSAMNVLQVVPKAIGQSELLEEHQEEAREKARVFAEAVQQLEQHFNINSAFIRYPVLTADVFSNLFRSVIWGDTVPQELNRAVNDCLSAVYKSIMKEGGLDDLNRNIIRELLCAADKAEQTLTLPPGKISLWLEDVIDDAMKKFLEPLDLSSEKYFKLRVNEASYSERVTRMLDSPSHIAFFEQRKAEGRWIEARETRARAEGIDRALNAELVRIQKDKQFDLEHAGALYTDALRKTLKPAIASQVSGKKAFESKVFNLLYKKPINDLDIFDLEDSGSCRLEAISKYISDLENYLGQSYDDISHDFLFYLFENEETYRTKRAHVQALRACLEDADEEATVRSQIEAVQARMNEQFQTEMFASTPGFSMAGIGRCLTWILSCFGICTYENTGIKALNHLSRTVDMDVSELQVFDALHAEDYRRLDAMLKEISALEKYLKPKYDSSYTGRSKLFENKETRDLKHAWLKQLRDIAEDETQKPEDRLQEMRRVMSLDAFKEEVLTYSATDNYTWFKSFKRGVLWLLSCVGLYTLPCVSEYKAMMHATDPEASYSDSALVNVALFRESQPSTERNYTAESALKTLGSDKTPK